jgi:uncharacterized RDD family membrane protein YckC
VSARQDRGHDCRHGLTALSTRDVLDTVVAVETPEGILLELRPAGLVPRFYAFMVDWMIRIAVMWAAALVTSIMGGIGFAFWLILLFALEWLYPIVFELMPSGATPGKRAFDLKVILDNGLPITPAASVTRNLLRAADFLPFAFGLAIVSMLVRSDCKRLGDVAAGTLVVYEPRASRKVVLTQVEPIAPARPLSPEDQAALAALAARASRLTPERLDELAAMAAVVSGNRGQAGPEVTRRVLGVAWWVLGGRS